jgi:hypothetical protein
MKHKAFYLVPILVLALLLAGVGYAQSEDEGVIRGSSFHDANRNGVRDPGEEPLLGAAYCIVNLNILLCDRTEFYDYEFFLDPGHYKIRVVESPEGYRPTRKQRHIKLGPGEVRTDVDFGFVPIPGKGHKDE